MGSRGLLQIRSSFGISGVPVVAQRGNFEVPRGTGTNGDRRQFTASVCVRLPRAVTD
jgi:hypothetical protein